MSDIELSEGVTYKKVDSEASKAFREKVQGHPKGFVRLQPYDQVMPATFLPFEKPMREFKVRPDDVWVCTFPKCGTTWSMEMVWCIINDADLEKARSLSQDERIPYVEMIGLCDEDMLKKYEIEMPNTLEQAAQLPSPRVLKSHLSIDMLPRGIMDEKTAKIVYVLRNPRDTCMSFFNHFRALEGFTGSLDCFVDAFLADECGYYTPAIGHMLGYWKARHQPNVLIISFEDMKRDLESVVRKTAAFLGKQVPEEKMKDLLEHLSFQSMKKNPMVNKQEYVEMGNKIFDMNFDPTSFMRQGKAGTWRQSLSAETVKRFEEWENKWLKDTDLSFQYE